MKPSLVYVIGYPGSGKTTAVRSIVNGLVFRVEDKPFKHTIYSDGMVQLGYEREVFGGTDSLGFNVQPKVVSWLKDCKVPLIIGEGDRLSNNKFFTSVLEQGWQLVIPFIYVSELLSMRRIKQRGTTFDASWLRRTMTKVDNVANRWHHFVVPIDGSGEPSQVAESLRNVLGEHQRS